MRATKIVATLGPATDGREAALLAAGVDVVRVNFSHGAAADHRGRVERIRAAAAELGRHIAVLGDLQGPKIRITGFQDDNGISLAPGQILAIDPGCPANAGTTEVVGTTYTTLADDVVAGDVLVLGDGLVELEVTGTRGNIVDTRVITGDSLSAGKGINKRGGGLAAPALTDKDRLDLRLAVDLELDYLAVSFPRAAADMDLARQLVRAAGGHCGLVAKVERAEALVDLDNLVLASDAVMVARGDLGIEIGDAALMAEQKRIIRRARRLNRSVITATQMMESMITNARPTRAEVMDVANAVVDGTDAVMLSGETAVGKYPVDTVKAMAEIIVGAEASSESRRDRRGEHSFEHIDDAIAAAAMQLAATLQGVTAVACLTGTGNTPKLMSRVASHLPIYAMADSSVTLSRVALYRGVHPVPFAAAADQFHKVDDEAVAWLRSNGAVAPGDRLILTKGDRRNVQGGTNTVRVITVGANEQDTTA